MRHAALIAINAAREALAKNGLPAARIAGARKAIRVADGATS